jgi:peptidoglycan hydrolase-like protein with peptidoglycan-binding domain
LFIDQGYTGSPNLNATVRDCENGAWTLARAVDRTGWNVQRPTLYLGYPDTVQAAYEAGWRGDVWVALPGWDAPRPPSAPAGINVVAVQNIYQAPFDLSTVYDPAWPLAAAPSVPVWQEDAMRALPTLSYGAIGGDVRTVQGLCNAREALLLPLVLDGIFGQQTRAAVEAVQRAHSIGVDGVVGPQTWPVLMGVA